MKNQNSIIIRGLKAPRVKRTRSLSAKNAYFNHNIEEPLIILCSSTRKLITIKYFTTTSCDLYRVSKTNSVTILYCGRCSSVSLWKDNNWVENRSVWLQPLASNLKKYVYPCGIFWWPTFCVLGCILAVYCWKASQIGTEDFFFIWLPKQPLVFFSILKLPKL